MKKRYNIGDRVAVNKDISRREGLYARAGETGTVLEVFRPISTGAGETKALCAKVLIGGSVKTFRLTSLIHTEGKA